MGRRGDAWRQQRGGASGDGPAEQSGVEEGLGGLPRSRVRLTGCRGCRGCLGSRDPGLDSAGASTLDSAGGRRRRPMGVAWRGRRRRTGVPVDLPRPPASPATALQEGRAGKSWKTRPTLGLRCSRHGLRAAADVARLTVVNCRCGRASFTSRRTVAAMTQTGILRRRQAMLLGRRACCICLLFTTGVQVAEVYCG